MVDSERQDRTAKLLAKAKLVGRLMHPQSIAIIGMSSRPGTASHTVLQNMRANQYKGDIYLVGRSGGTIEGLPCLTEVEQLPEGVDLGILVVPAEAVKETVEACIRRGMKTVACFASGFAEASSEGREHQEELGRIAEEAGIAIMGPNCLGYFNYVDEFAVMLVPTAPVGQYIGKGKRAIGVISQSGGFGHHLAMTLQRRGVPVSYMITTGNEADLSLSDIMAFMLEDPATQGIICYAEQVKRPADLLAVAELSRSKGKPILMMIPGRSEQARAATATHTGAMSGDYAVMRMMVEESGIVVLDTLEDLLDVGQIMRQHPHHTGGGLGVVTSSGGICGLTQDYCATLGLEVPPLSQAQADKLKPHLQSFVTPRNPLDLGTLPAWQPKLMEEGILAMLGDPAVGSVMVANAYVGPPISTAWASFTTTVPQEKPLIYVVFNEDVPLPEEADKIMREHGTVVMRSPERAMRALAALTAYTRRRMAWEKPLPAVPFADLPGLGSHGPQPEWLSKQLLAKMGIATPEGGLATTADEAVAIANRVGYPVALKAQAATLTHKSDAGGVLLGIGDDAGLRRQWQVLYDNIARAEPGLKLDGALVEKMGARGVELVVGARRDPQWGPVLLVGLGGVWIEALGDVKLLPAGVSETRIIAALRQLKGAKLLQGFRGAPPVDMQAVARVAAAVGRLMLTRPDIAEIDVNPLIAYGEGEGAVALDALIVTQ